MSSLVPFVILPVIILGTLIFVFQSGLDSVENEQFLQNCPLPIYDGVAVVSPTNAIINGIFVNYTVNYGAGGQNGTNTFNTIFTCDIDPITGNKGIDLIIKEYDPSGWSTAGFNFAWFDYVADTTTQVFDRGGHAIRTVWLYFNAPAEVSQVPFFTFVNAVLVSWAGIGLFIIFRGGGG